eukprot:8445850-Pyramimonas_sp.AAC.1
MNHALRNATAFASCENLEHSNYSVALPTTHRTSASPRLPQKHVLLYIESGYRFRYAPKAAPRRYMSIPASCRMPYPYEDSPRKIASQGYALIPASRGMLEYFNCFSYRG